MPRRNPRDTRDSTYERSIRNRKEKEKRGEDKQKEVYLRIEITQKKTERQLDGRHSSIAVDPGGDLNFRNTCDVTEA